MTATAIRADLLNAIDGLSPNQLMEVYGLFQNYLHSAENEDWNHLSEAQKSKIESGIKQADAGNTIPLSEVMQRMRTKHGLNG